MNRRTFLKIAGVTIAGAVVPLPGIAKVIDLTMQPEYPKTGIVDVSYMAVTENDDTATVTYGIFWTGPEGDREMKVLTEAEYKEIFLANRPIKSR